MCNTNNPDIDMLNDSSPVNDDIVTPVGGQLSLPIIDEAIKD